MNPDNKNSGKVRRLFIFFFLVYIAEGMCMETGIIAQPLAFYLKTSLGWSADQVTAYLTVLIIPWVIKPLYGLLSDFIPLFGYRRKSWLFIANALCTVSYVWMIGLTAPSQIIISLFLSMGGMAASSALCQAVMVEGGKQTGLTSNFVNSQWLWAAAALIVASLGGGWLCEHYLNQPAQAFHIAALVAAIVPVGAFIGCWFLIDEPQQAISKEQLAASGRGFINALKSPTLWIVGLFLACFNFNPSAGQPQYYFMTDNLKFSQEFIGLLGAIGAGGAVVGSLVYMYFLQHERTPRVVRFLCRYTGVQWLHRVIGRAAAAFCGLIGWQRGQAFFARFAADLEEINLMKALVYLSIVLGIAAQAAMALLAGHTSAIVLSIGTQVAAQITVVTLLTLAAHACPDDAEGFSYAWILSMYNLGGQIGANLGSNLYEHWFSHQLAPLALLSAAFTTICFLLAPMLPRDSLKDPDTGEK